MKRKIILLSIASTFTLAMSQGEALYTKHGCYGCHGSDAKGGNGFPSLAGKSVYYLKKKLHEYKQGTINSNKANMMKPFAQKLSDEEIERLAKYLNSLGKKKKNKEEHYYQEFTIGDSSGS